MTSARESKHISKLFIQEAHHRNWTVIFPIRNLFCQGGEMSSISLNAHFLALCKIPREKSLIRCLADQIFRDNWKSVRKLYEHATQDQHSYLLIDLQPETPEQYIVLSNIFPGEQIRFSLPVTLAMGVQMAPRKKIPNRKITITYLATCKQPEIISRILAKSPDNLIKSICDRA